MRVWSLASATILMIIGMATAAPVVVIDDWEDGVTPDPEGWQKKAGGYGDLDDGINQTWLKITRTAAPENPMETALIYGNDPLAGDVNYFDLGVQSIRFDFYADADQGSGPVEQPAGLRLYFTSYSSGNIWYYTIPVGQISSGWGSYGANVDALDHGAWWTSGDESQWVADFQDVDEIGIYLTYQPPAFGLQTYGIDNFILDDELLPVPEPETYMFLAMALTCLLVVFRDRWSDAFALVRSSCSVRRWK